MAKKTDAGAAADGPKKMMPADCFSAFMALSGLTTVTKAQLELMSHLDGVRTADSYQHSFRSVVAKAKELKKRIDEGEKFEPVAPGGKKSGGSTPATPRKRNADGKKAVETPSKRSKTTPKGKSMDDTAVGGEEEGNGEEGADGEGSFADAFYFIKEELEEEGQADFV